MKYPLLAGLNASTTGDKVIGRTGFAICLWLLIGTVAVAHPGVGDRIHRLDDAIANEPANQYWYIQRSLAHSENGSSALAFQDITQATRLGEPANAAFVHGVLLYREGCYILAREKFDLYLALHPEHVASLEYRARLLRDAGQYEAALSDFLRIFDLNPAPNPGLYISASTLMIQLPLYGPDAAVSLLDNGMAKLGPVTQLQRKAITLETQQNNYLAAIERMHKLPQALRETPQWKIDLARLHFRNHDRKGARILLADAASQLDQLPRNGMRDTARNELLLMQRQLEVGAAQEQRASGQL